MKIISINGAVFLVNLIALLEVSLDYLSGNWPLIIIFMSFMYFTAKFFLPVFSSGWRRPWKKLKAIGCGAIVWIVMVTGPMLVGGIIRDFKVKKSLIKGDVLIKKIDSYYLKNGHYPLNLLELNLNSDEINSSMGFFLDVPFRYYPDIERGKTNEKFDKEEFFEIYFTIGLGDSFYFASQGGRRPRQWYVRRQW